jgi:tetratricopeptide (TPR) repeat protein
MPERVQPIVGLNLRILTIAIAVIAIGTAYFGAKWQLGDMLARLTAPADPNAAMIADATVRLAPSDPYASALRAEVFDPTSEDTRSAVEIAEETVRLSPNDHRWHLSLARALASDDQTARAEAEFKRAIELAPSYAECRWYYGNFLLRADRSDDAVAEFKIAAANDPEYRAQVLSLMWDYSAHDPAVLESIAGDGVDNIAQLARFLAAHGRGSDALRNWERLTDDQKASRSEITRLIAEGLYEQHCYVDALQFSRQLGADPTAKAETITNGSFETSIDGGEDSHFNWRVNHSDPKLDVSVDDRVKHEGARSLRLTFKSTAKPNLFNAAQTVAVTPNTRYRLTFWVRTENLKTPVGPLIDISTGNETKSLAHTNPFPNGTNEWRQFNVDFAVPADVDGIEIRTLRWPCSGDDCPISGIVWYDDFVLTRL